MDDILLQHLPDLNFVEIVCLYLLFDVKKSFNRLSEAIDRLTDKVDKIEKLEAKVDALENAIKQIL